MEVTIGKQAKINVNMRIEKIQFVVQNIDPQKLQKNQD